MSNELIGDLLSVGGKVQEERDRLAVELQESERLRQEAFATCETMRQEAFATCETMRQQVAALQAQLDAAAVTPAELDDVGPLGCNIALKLENDELKKQQETLRGLVEELKKQIEKDRADYSAAARQALVKHEATKGLLQEAEAERVKQKELLGVYKSMQRLIDAYFLNDV
jgi:Skp family chaperone for outer membrane proteins